MTTRLNRRLFLALGGAVGLGAAFSTPAVAQDASEYPNRMISFVVPFPPGGTLDIATRLIARGMETALGQTVTVDNRPGAGGNIGADHVAESQPDGYTILMGAVSTHGINVSLFDDMPFDPIDDFKPVTLVSRTPNVLIVPAASGIRSIEELVKNLRASDDNRIFASGSNGSAGHLAGELFAQGLDLSLTHVPYQGSAAALLALLGGEVSFMFDNLASASSYIDSGEVVPLAVTTQARTGFLGDVPTMQESGFENFDLSTWIGVLAPADTPAAIVTKLDKTISEVLREPTVAQGFASQRAEILAKGPAEFASFIDSEIARYAAIIRDGDLSLN